MTGTSISQLIPILFSPLLTRLYTPYEFGLFAVFFSLSSILGIVSSARYDMAIVLPKSNSVANGIFKLSLILVVFSSLLCLLVISLIFSRTYRYRSRIFKCFDFSAF